MDKEEKKARAPVLAIVGRPNVGKSTLFNRLVGGRAAIVDHTPGVTRDRLYGLMHWRGRAWSLVDTGGFEPSGSDIPGRMRAQTEIALHEADAIIFLLDAKHGLTPSDREVADTLRRSGKPVLFAVNKVDGPSQQDKTAEFYELGADRLFPVSAEHGFLVDELLDAVYETAPGVSESDLAEDSGTVTRVAVVGRPNVGKSTLVNALLGEERHLVHPEPGTTRDAVDSEVEISGKSYLFVDTAGMRRKKRIESRLERYSVLRAIKGIERCHLALLMVDAGTGIVDQDAKIAGLAVDRGRALILLFNKWDLVSDKKERKRELEYQAGQRLPHARFAPLLTVSAKHGAGLKSIPGMIERVAAEYNRRISTAELNRELKVWLDDTPPPSGKTPLSIYYATQTSVRPPTVVFFVNRAERVPAHYQRYLENRVRKSFGFQGCPVKTYFRTRGKARKSRRNKDG